MASVSLISATAPGLHLSRRMCGWCVVWFGRFDHGVRIVYQGYLLVPLGVVFKCCNTSKVSILDRKEVKEIHIFQRMQEVM
jgi:hypothetical protein